MTQFANYPLNSDFSAVNTLQAMGTVTTGALSPNGIDGALIIASSTMLSKIDQSMPTTATGIRSEITAPAFAVTGEYSMYWEFMIPKGAMPLLDPIIVMQVHTPDLDPVNAIPFALNLYPSGILVASVPSQVLPASGTGTVIVGMVDLIPGHWYRACLHVNWQPNTNGLREFFLDDMPVFRQFNVPTTYNDGGNGGNYFKVGCYDGTHNARFGSMQMSVRNVLILAGSPAGYNDISNHCPLPKTLLIR